MTLCYAFERNIGGDNEKMHSSYRGSYDDSEMVDYSNTMLADTIDELPFEVGAYFLFCLIDFMQHEHSAPELVQFKMGGRPHNCCISKIDKQV